jgi:hypothetical protein
MTEPIYKNIKSTFYEATRVQKKGDYLFFTFDQNNSGGSFHDSENFGQHVIIAALSAEEANSLAKDFGLYFDGSGDCACCGNRWYRATEGLGTEAPELYGKDLETYLATSDFHDKVVVHYPDGSRRVIERMNREVGRRRY